MEQAQHQYTKSQTAPHSNAGLEEVCKTANVDLQNSHQGVRSLQPACLDHVLSDCVTHDASLLLLPSQYALELIHANTETSEGHWICHMRPKSTLTHDKQDQPLDAWKQVPNGVTGPGHYQYSIELAHPLRTRYCVREDWHKLAFDTSATHRGPPLLPGVKPLSS